MLSDQLSKIIDENHLIEVKLSNPLEETDQEIRGLILSIDEQKAHHSRSESRRKELKEEISKLKLDFAEKYIANSEYFDTEGKRLESHLKEKLKMAIESLQTARRLYEQDAEKSRLYEYNEEKRKLEKTLQSELDQVKNQIAEKLQEKELMDEELKSVKEKFALALDKRKLFQDRILKNDEKVTGKSNASYSDGCSSFFNLDQGV